MDNDLRLYYEELMDLFSHPGWRHVQEKIDQVLEAHTTQGWTLPNGDELLINKGIVQNLQWMKNFQEAHEVAFQQAEEEATAPPEEE